MSFELYGQKKAPKPNDLGAFRAFQMVLKCRIGGGGGNRTRVRKSATRGPTCLVSSLIYPCRYRRTGATRGARDLIVGDPA